MRMLIKGKRQHVTKRRKHVTKKKCVQCGMEHLEVLHYVKSHHYSSTFSLSVTQT